MTIPESPKGKREMPRIFRVLGRLHDLLKRERLDNLAEITSEDIVEELHRADWKFDPNVQYSISKLNMSADTVGEPFPASVPPGVARKADGDTYLVSWSGTTRRSPRVMVGEYPISRTEHNIVYGFVRNESGQIVEREIGYYSRDKDGEGEDKNQHSMYITLYK